MAQNKNIGQLAAMSATDAANAAHQMLIRDPSQGTASNRTKSVRLDVLRGALQRLGAAVADITDPLYGAVANEVTAGFDCLAAINAALTALVAKGGGILYVPAGTFLVSATPTYPTGVPIRIVGAGRFRSMIKHKTGGAVVNWTQNHLASEYGSGIEHISFDGNGGTATVVTLTNLTLAFIQSIHVTNSLGVGTGIALVSCWDSCFGTLYITDCGDATHPCSVWDALGVGNNSLNNCTFTDWHVEPTNCNAYYLDVIGNATNGVEDNRTFGLKLHGDPTSGNPALALLRLSGNTRYNAFYMSLFAFGKGTEQVQDGGTRNVFFGDSYGIGGAGTPTWAIRCTATSNTSIHYSPVVKTPNLYGSVNRPFRVDSGSTHNEFVKPLSNFGGIANPMDDQGGRSSIEWTDLATNQGKKVADNEGHQWAAGTQMMDARIDLTWGAAVTVQNFQSRKFFLNATTNIAATLSAPVSATASTQTQRISITFRNSSGGALTTPIAFNAGAGGYKVSGTVAPANGTQITIDLDYDQAQNFWIETSRSAAV